MTIDEIKRKLESVLSPKRFEHSLGVMDTAITLRKNMAECGKGGLGRDFARLCKGNKGTGRI